MSCFDVQILNPDIYTIQIETCIGDQPASIDVITYDNTSSIEINHCVPLLSEIEHILPVQNILGGSGIVVSSNSGIYTISSTGLQPSGNYSLVGHTHTSSNITDFKSAVSGLLPSISGSGYVNSSFNNNIYTISVTGLQPSGNYSVVGHSHTASDITNFNSSVSGLLPVKNVTGSGYVNVSSSSGIYNIAVTGLQPSGNYANSIHSHGNITSSGTIGTTAGKAIVTSTSGLLIASDSVTNSQWAYGLYNNQADPPQPYLSFDENNFYWHDGSFANNFRASINAASSVHSHGDITNSGTIGSTSGLLVVTGSGGVLTTSSGVSSSYITNFNSSVSGLLPVKNILGSGYINVGSSSGVYTISTTGLQPSGNYSVVGHNHGNISSSGAIGSTSGLLVITGNSGVLTTTSGITSSYITNFNSSVSGLLPTISNSGNNRILTSTGSSVGINAESNLIFDGTTLSIPSGYMNISVPIGATNGIALDVSGVGKFGELSNIVFIGHDLLGGELGLSTNAEYLAAKSLPDLSIRYGGNEDNPAIVIASGLNVGIKNDTPVYTLDVNGSGNFSSDLYVNGVPVSVSGHTHSSSDITDSTSFGRNILTAASYAAQNKLGWQIVSNVSSISGVDGGQYYCPTDTTFVGPVGHVSFIDPVSGSPGHFYTIVKPSGFPSNIIVGGTTYSSASGVYIERYWSYDVAFPPSGSWKTRTLDDYHEHTSSQITDFNSSVSGLLPSVSGSGYVNSSFNNNIYTISVTGLQPSGNYSVVGHTHISNDITDFSSSVSGLLPVKNIVAGTSVNVSSVSGEYTISVTGVAATSASSLTTTCHNLTGSTIPKLSAVYINGGHGNEPTINLAIANSEAGSSKTFGITMEDINFNQSGNVVVVGSLIDVNTNQFGVVEGTTLYLSPSVSGALTTTKPLAPNHLVSLGKIVRNHNNQGVIQVSVQNGFELGELHNVSTNGSGDNGKFLQYNSASGLWVSSSSGNFTTLQLNGTGVSVSGHTHNSSNIIDFNSSVSGLLPTISNSGDNRILTSTGSSVGIDAESNLTFDGSTLNVDGNLIFDSFTESVVAIGNSSTSQTLSLTSGTVQTCTLTGNCTFTMPTATAGKSFTMFLNTGSGNYTASFSGVLWSDSAPPTITTTASKVDILSFISDGSYWYGSYSQNYG